MHDDLRGVSEMPTDASEAGDRQYHHMRWCCRRSHDLTLSEEKGCHGEEDAFEKETWPRVHIKGTLLALNLVHDILVTFKLGKVTPE
jgi:hypothetical protein